MKLSDYLLGVGRPVAYYPKLRRITGSTNATIFLCQFVYWTGKEESGDGWIYKTSEEIEGETGLSYKEQTNAREKLVSGGLLLERNARLEHRIYYKINLDNLNDRWGTDQEADGQPPKGQLANTPKVNSLNSNTENTTENTSYNDNLSNSSSKKVPESIEWMIAAGVSSEKIADLTAKERHSKEITDCYEKEMGYNNLPWGKLERLKRFLLAKTPDEIKQFAIWSKGKFSAFTPAKARLYPDMVIDLFPQAFLTEVKPPSMYDILAKQIEEERNGSSEIRS